VLATDETDAVLITHGHRHTGRNELFPAPGHRQPQARGDGRVHASATAISADRAGEHIQRRGSAADPDAAGRARSCA
jgi:hypothetical protein